jgi:hypothetical protein
LLLLNKEKLKKEQNSTYPLSFSQGVIFPKQQSDEKKRTEILLLSHTVFKEHLFFLKNTASKPARKKKHLHSTGYKVPVFQ